MLCVRWDYTLDSQFTYQYAFEDREETREPGENPHGQGENIHNSTQTVTVKTEPWTMGLHHSPAHQSTSTDTALISELILAQAQ